LVFTCFWWPQSLYALMIWFWCCPSLLLARPRPGRGTYLLSSCFPFDHYYELLVLLRTKFMFLSTFRSMSSGHLLAVKLKLGCQHDQFIVQPVSNSNHCNEYWYSRRTLTLSPGRKQFFDRWLRS
jgi:hypothetical protein